MKVDTLIEIVEDYHKLPAGSVRGRKRSKQVSLARKQALLLARQYTQLSWSELEEDFDKKFKHTLPQVSLPFGLKWKLFWKGVF